MGTLRWTCSPLGTRLLKTTPSVSSRRQAAQVRGAGCGRRQRCATRRLSQALATTKTLAARASGTWRCTVARTPLSTRRAATFGTRPSQLACAGTARQAQATAYRYVSSTRQAGPQRRCILDRGCMRCTTPNGAATRGRWTASTLRTARSASAWAAGRKLDTLQSRATPSTSKVHSPRSMHAASGSTMRRRTKCTSSPTGPYQRTWTALRCVWPSRGLRHSSTSRAAPLRR
mmetsp:Transcript_38165/g.89326  ORF Transcript_38165/g.89326 Transcript_38165/m.89326 type:complete len:231 (-) Transcript_38165:610-1302(-)